MKLIFAHFNIEMLVLSGPAHCYVMLTL